MNDLSTSDRIINASILLFSQKGYDAVTTKEIARKAGVCEMTLFRHFENKRNLFEKAFENYVFIPKFKTLFESQLSGELEADLLKISCCYQDTLAKNQQLILMQFKNNELTSEVEAPLSKFPNELKKLLMKYLVDMRNKGFVKENPEVLAINFLAFNFGIFMMFIVNKHLTKDIDINTFLMSYVKKVVNAQAQNF